MINQQLLATAGLTHKNIQVYKINQKDAKNTNNLKEKNFVSLLTFFLYALR